LAEGELASGVFAVGDALDFLVGDEAVCQEVAEDLLVDGWR